VLSSLLSYPVAGAVLVFAVVGVVLLIRAWSRRMPQSLEEREELASAPMPPLQKRAWWGLLISGVTFVVIAVILFNEGAAAYWEDDDLRLVVLAIFLAGLFGYVAVVLVNLVKQERRGDVDERDRSILSRAPNVQSAGVIIALAAWTGALPKMFRVEGAVPVVYLYLMFGSVILVSLIAQSAGILLGYWLVARRGQS
jgi:hypothetical protein